MRRAVSFGVVFYRPSGEVVRIMNPDFEEQLDGHHVGPDEFMLRMRKADYAIGDTPNAMTLPQVHKIIEIFSR